MGLIGQRPQIPRAREGSRPYALRTAGGRSERAPIYLASNTGMRRGGVPSLTWRHVDLDVARLTVDHQILSVEYESFTGDVKTSNSRRTIDLDPRTVAVLRAWRKQQLEQQMGSAGETTMALCTPASTATRSMTAYPHVLPVTQADAAAAFSAAVFDPSDTSSSR